MRAGFALAFRVMSLSYLSCPTVSLLWEWVNKLAQGLVAPCAFREALTGYATVLLPLPGIFNDLEVVRLL